MWGTSHGDRTLNGHEAALVRKSVGYLRDMITASIDLDEPYQTDVSLFNQLQPTQQLAVLHEVAFALLDSEVEILELTAVREATVYAIFKELNSLIEMEIDFAKSIKASLNPNLLSSTAFDLASIPPEFQTRALVEAAIHQANDSPEEWEDGNSERQEFDSPPIDSTSFECWSATIETLANRILWDRDFELESVFADHDPSQVSDIKAYLGINDDYFSTAAPDAYSDEFQRIDRELVELTRLGS